MQIFCGFYGALRSATRRQFRWRFRNLIIEFLICMHAGKDDGTVTVQAVTWEDEIGN